MPPRRRPAADPPPIGDVRDHAQLVGRIMDEHPDWGYRRVGRELGEILGVTLEPRDYQAVLRLQKAADPMAGTDGFFMRLAHKCQRAAHVGLSGRPRKGAGCYRVFRSQSPHPFAVRLPCSPRAV